MDCFVFCTASNNFSGPSNLVGSPRKASHFVATVWKICEKSCFNIPSLQTNSTVSRVAASQSPANCCLPAGTHLLKELCLGCLSWCMCSICADLWNLRAHIEHLYFITKYKGPRLKSCRIYVQRDTTSSMQPNFFEHLMHNIAKKILFGSKVNKH